MTHSENGKELTKQAVAEHFRSAARLQELEADATTPWVKRYLRSLMEEREQMVGGHEASEGPAPAYLNRP